MGNQRNKIAIFLSALLMTVFMSGCQTITQEQLDEVRNLALEAQRAAEAADVTANQARSIALEARTDAGDAQVLARDALSTAGQAQTCCEENTQRIERMFNTMQKK